MAAARPMRVAVLRPYATLPSEGGANDRYVNLCEKLVELGSAPQLYCSDFVHNSKQRRSAAAIALNQQRLPYLRQIRSLPYRRNVSIARIAHEALFGLKALVRIAARPRPDVLVVGEPLFLVGWLALFYGLCFRTPVVADLIDLWPEADTALHSGLSGALRWLAYAALIASRGLRLRRYQAVSFVSRAYARRLSPGRSAPVFYWGSQLAPRGPRTLHSGPLVAIYAGSLGVGYDIETLLEAAAILRAESAPLSVVIAGDGPKRDHVLRAQREGVVDYLGQLSREQLIEAYERAAIGLLPYHAGSKVAMPIKFFDYVNFGLYVVSSLDMEAQDMIAERAIGVSYAPGDARDLAAKLRQAANDRAALERARTASATLAQELAVDAQYERFARFVLDQLRHCEERSDEAIRSEG
jgi:glycosyltransferase involved in cell wall biosynthesis